MDAGNYAALIPMLVRLMASPHYIVHTYAANAVERMLMVRDRGGIPGQIVKGRASSTLRFGKERLAPHLQSLLVALFGILERPGYDHADNEYVMKAVMRVLGVAAETSAPFIAIALQKLVVVLTRVKGNPANPTFNHHLFEAIAALVSNVCKSDASGAVVGQFEEALFPPFNAVLGEQVTEFSPYVFQILAQLLEFNSTHAALASKPLSSNYTVLFPLLLNPVNWMNRGDVPALVRLVAAYLIKDGASIAAKNQLPAVLGVFQKLLSAISTERYAFELLNSLISSPAILSGLQPFLPQIFQLLLTRFTKRQSLACVATPPCPPPSAPSADIARARARARTRSHTHASSLPASGALSDTCATSCPSLGSSPRCTAATRLSRSLKASRLDCGQWCANLSTQRACRSCPESS